MTLATSRGHHTCKQCRHIFTPKWPSGPHAFCSRECRNKSFLRRVTKNCERCSLPFTKHKSRQHTRFCSRSCSGKSTASKRPLVFRAERSATSKSRAKEIYGSACLICKFDRVIEYAHIVPARNGGTIHPSNILPLCPNHHTLFDKGLLTAEELQAISGRLVSV